MTRETVSPAGRRTASRVAPRRVQPYVGSGPYCYANSLLAMLGDDAPGPAVMETLTGSPFGFQLIAGRIPLFDPYGWDPDTGIEQALQLLGYASDRYTFGSAADACSALRDHLRHGPVMLGPLEMGLLHHQPGANGPVGADHFVVALEIDDGAVVFHDPQGYPWSRLPIDLFCAAWNGESVAYANGAYPMRVNFRRVAPRDVRDAVLDSLPEAAGWLAGRDSAMPPESLGGAEGLEALARQAAAGPSKEIKGILMNFAVRLGARRRVDAAVTLGEVDEVEAADLLQEQARELGAAQLHVVTGDDQALSNCFTRLAQLHTELSLNMSRHLAG